MVGRVLSPIPVASSVASVSRSSELLVFGSCVSLRG
jgi:hypothetical protein